MATELTTGDLQVICVPPAADLIAKDASPIMPVNLAVSEIHKGSAYKVEPL